MKLLIVSLLCLLAFCLAIAPKENNNGILRPSTVKHFEPVSINIPTNYKRDGRFELDIETHGRSMKLRLEPNTELFHPDIEFHFEDGSGQRTKFDFDVGIYYRGIVVGEEDSIHYNPVGLAVEGDKNRVTGFIHTKNESFYLEDSRVFLGEGSPFKQVAYKWSAVERPSNSCGVVDEHNHGSHSVEVPSFTNLTGGASEYGKRQSGRCTLSLVSDSYFYETRWGSSKFDTIKAMCDSVNGAETIYRNQIGSGFQILGTLIFASTNDPLRTSSASGINTLLTTFESLKSGSQGYPPIQTSKCTNHGFTYNDYSGTLGLAYVGTICNTYGTTGVTTGLSFGKPLDAVNLMLTVAHEIGHNHGANHDPSSSCTDPVANRGYIMSACSSAPPGPIPFSPTSVSTIQSTVTTRGTCFGSGIGTSRCGNNFVESGEQCDCGASCGTCCSSSCGYLNGAVCDPSNGKCCNPSTCGLYTSGTSCGTSPYSWVPAPTCDGASATCYNCFPGAHPCNKYSNTAPCQNTANPCQSACMFTNQGTTCYPGSQISGLTVNMPDGTCCAITGVPRGWCQGGSCVNRPTPPTPAPPTPYPTPPPTPPPLNPTPPTPPPTPYPTPPPTPPPTPAPTPCVPDPNACAGKTCGTVNNGCGSASCGTCANGALCNTTNYQCPCVPTTTCAGKCGSIFNGCNYVNCGGCTAGSSCVSSTCVCTPKTCAQLGKNCGTNVPDGCSGTIASCGSCDSGYTCSADNVCVVSACSPSTSCALSSRECGSLNTGCATVNCGSCSAPFTCSANGTCVCTPTTSCAAQGKTCGILSNNGCGTEVCGNCQGVNDQCVNYNCVCIPDGTCSSQNVQCGNYNDGCSIQKCGSCVEGVLCNNGQCVVPGCTPTSTCASAGKSCGTIDNGCTTISCGTCDLSTGMQCDAVVGICVNTSSLSLTDSALNDSGMSPAIIGVIVAVILCIIFIVFAVLLTIFLYKRKQKKDAEYSHFQSDTTFETKTNNSMGMSSVSSPPTLAVPSYSTLAQKSAPAPTPAPAPMKALPPAPARPLPAPIESSARPPPTNPNYRQSVKIPAKAIIPQAAANAPVKRTPGRVPPTPPGAVPSNPSRPIEITASTMVPPPARSLPAPKKPRPQSVKRPLPAPGVIPNGTKVKAKYSGDGEFYDAFVRDFQHGNYLIEYPEYDNFQEWTAKSNVKN